MKKLLIPIILATFLLAGCTSQKAKLTDDQLFEKKQECNKYKDEIQKVIDNSLIRDDDEYFSYQVRLKEIFYSPVKNSCLYSVYHIETRKSNPSDSCGSYTIQDFLANDTIVWAYLEVELAPDNKTINCLWDKTDEVYNKALKELKGE